MISEPGSIKEIQARLVTEVAPAVPLNSTAKTELDARQPSKLDEVIIQDVVRRHEGLVQLIYHNDRKAVQLIGIYFAIIGALSTVLIANLKSVELVVATAAVSIVACLFFGVISAFRAHWTVPIFLTGMKPDFWEWARKNFIPANDVMNEYLLRAAASLQENESINDASSKHLKRAYVAGITATVVAITVISGLVITSSLCRAASPVVWGVHLCRLL